jgi:DNA polymerase type B, organellar and viral
VKHLHRRASIIRFTAPRTQRTPRGMRKHSRVPVRRGFFVDAKTIGAALTSRSDTLASLAEFLNVPSRKLTTEEHGGPLTREYLDYAMQDVQVTWECYAELHQRYAKHGLTQTPIHRIKSEAGIGKAYLKEMVIKPWRLVQPDFPAEMINIIMQTYFGGRSEVHLRRIIAQVLYCDFLSMYPTVCTLMGLW